MSYLVVCIWWRGGTIGRASDLWFIGHGFWFLPQYHCAVALGQLLTPVCLCHQAV